MAKVLTHIIAILLATVIVSVAAQAAFEVRMNYQGRLTDANGVPLADGAKNMTFSIWSAETGGSNLWSEGPTSVTTKDGLFSVILGGTSAINLDFNSAQYWIEMQVDSTTYTPRQRIAATAMSANTYLFDGKDSSQYATSAHSHAMLTRGTGISGSSAGYNGSAADTWSVTYGSSAGTAAEGNKQLTINAGTGLTGTQTITIGAGGTVNMSVDTSGYFDPRYVNISGDTMTGSLIMGPTTSIYFDGTSFAGAGQIQSPGILKIANGASAQELYAKQLCASDLWADCDANKVTNGIYSKANIKTAGQLVSTVAPGTAPLAVSSTTAVANLNADLLDGWHASATRNEANTIPVRDSNGYLQLGWINTTSGNAGTTALDRIYASYDGYIRYYTPANFLTVMSPTFDGRYVLKTGDTMTGALNISYAGHPGLEMRSTNNGTPFIDFSNDNASDYDARLILTGDDNLDVTGATLNLNQGASVRTMESAWSGWNVALKFPDTSHAALYYPTGGLLFGMHSNTNFYWANTTSAYYTMTLSNIGDLTLRNNATIQGGNAYLVDTNTRLTRGAGNALRMQTNSGYVDMGPQNTGWAHFTSDRASFYFNPKITVDGNVEPYTNNTRDLGTNTLRWRNLYLAGSPANGALTPNIIQSKKGPGTGADNQTHEVLCDAGYAITNFSVYHTNYADGDITLTCGYVGDLLNTGDNVWTAYSGTCDNCWHSATCPAGYIARGFSIYASGRLDTNMRLYCTRIASGNYTQTDHWIRSGGSGDGGDDDCWHSVMCPAGSYFYGVTVWATSYPDEDWGAACRAIRP